MKNVYVLKLELQKFGGKTEAHYTGTYCEKYETAERIKRTLDTSKNAQVLAALMCTYKMKVPVSLQDADERENIRAVNIAIEQFSKMEG